MFRSETMKRRSVENLVAASAALNLAPLAAGLSHMDSGFPAAILRDARLWRALRMRMEYAAAVSAGKGAA